MPNGTAVAHHIGVTLQPDGQVIEQGLQWGNASARLAVPNARSKFVKAPAAGPPRFVLAVGAIRRQWSPRKIDGFDAQFLQIA